MPSGVKRAINSSPPFSTSSPRTMAPGCGSWIFLRRRNRAKGALDAATRLVLTNAIYFNAAWAEPFTPEKTRDGAFNLLDGGKVTVPMMNLTEFFSYGQGEGYQAVALPYDKRELSMLIVMPAAGQWNAFERSLDARRVEGIVKSLESKRVVLSMPKFKVESSFQLAEALHSLGMRDAFEPSLADFS